LIKLKNTIGYILSMDITYIATGRIPTQRAFGYATMKLCEAFAAEGNKITLLLPDRRNDLNADPFKYYTIKQNFTIQRLESTDYLDGARKKIPYAYWLDAFSFIRALRKNKISQKAGIFYTRDYLLLLALPKGRVVLELHSIPERSLLFTFCIRRAQKIVTISHGIETRLLKLGIPKSIITVAPDAVDLNAFANMPSKEEARKKLNLPLNEKIALYSGHFYEWKGAEVFAETARHMPGVSCVLVGGVDEEYQRLKDAYDGTNNVTILPFQPRELVPVYLAAADVLVLPNRSISDISAKYTSPLKLFEYMAAGRPIVASDLSSIREVLDENTAVLVKPDDPKALAEGIQKLLSDQALAKKLADEAHQKVQNFTWAKRAQTILSFIQP